jgi:hypothetical protein
LYDSEKAWSSINHSVLSGGGGGERCTILQERYRKTPLVKVNVNSKEETLKNFVREFGLGTAHDRGKKSLLSLASYLWDFMKAYGHCLNRQI